MSTRTNAAWLAALRAREPQAERDLWELLFRFGVLAARSYGQLDEVGQSAATEAYLKLLERGLDQFKDQGPFEGYCRVIVLNQVRDHLPRPATVSAALPLDLAAPEPTPSSDGVLGRLRPCLERLPAPEQRVIALLYLHELTPDMVADQLQLTRNHVNVLAHRARKKLKQCLIQQGYTRLTDLL